MSRLAQGRQTHIVDPVTVGSRMERLTRDNARNLNLPVAKILRDALEEAVEVAMRERNYQHPEEIPQDVPSSWLGFFRWW